MYIYVLRYIFKLECMCGSARVRAGAYPQPPGRVLFDCHMIIPSMLYGVRGLQMVPTWLYVYCMRPQRPRDFGFC
jgi:hypothetical protein